MGINEAITLNRITGILSEAADRHQQIKDFSVGERSDIGNSDETGDELKHPYLWVNYGQAILGIGSSRQIQYKIYNMSLFVADKHYKNIVNNARDIASNTQDMLTDIVTYLLGHEDLRRVIVMDQGEIACEIQRSPEKDDVFGWACTIPIKVPYNFCATQLPIV